MLQQRLALEAVTGIGCWPLMLWDPVPCNTAVQELENLHLCSLLKYQKMTCTLIANTAAWVSVRFQMSSARVQVSKGCLFGRVAQWRVILSNIWKLNGVFCAACSPRPYCQLADYLHIVQKWNARPELWASVLLPISSLFEHAVFKSM